MRRLLTEKSISKDRFIKEWFSVKSKDFEHLFLNRTTPDEHFKSEDDIVFSSFEEEDLYNNLRFYRGKFLCVEDMEIFEGLFPEEYKQIKNARNSILDKIKKYYIENNKK